MGEAVFTFRVDNDLKSAFVKLAEARDLSAAELLLDLMRREVGPGDRAFEYDAWFRVEIEQALREADDPAVEREPNEIVEAEWLRQRAELVKRAGGR